ncbi:RHS repeat-associated core domain-containing protein [Streptomyces sp. ISL-86]|uniref:RHS repeat-associated core domain-containing protein n=1 Tax=Streptomyces sp. ISL-86 TaxID=2819187 RepID=UPI001BEBF3EF|nr:RHS repeat-associated core domain-containing protein [Streptomyces sp. ISL-86]MBT2456853.1 RHS repeat protein [Streptomyces sp. ISL-86]
MTGLGDETTEPATTPDRDTGPPSLRVRPEMTDEQIRAELRTWYIAAAEDASLGFEVDPDIPTKDLASFKAMLNDFWSSADPDFGPRFDRLRSEVVDELAPQMFAYVSGDATHSIRQSFNVAPTTASGVATASDPVQLFDGELRYSTVDLQLNGAGIDFLFVRTYSQLIDYAGPMGEKWDHSYNLWVRVDDGGNSLHRSTGALAEETFVRHETFDYWVPPVGVHGIVVRDGDALVFVRSDGARITYEQQPGVVESVFLATRIADRFGNELTLDYTYGLLAGILVNQPERRVAFHYDDQRRITAVQDFTGRTWRYHYDTDGDLVAVTAPATQALPRGATTRYEYLGPALAPPELAHHLVSVLDADGRLYLENAYGIDAGLLSYRRVVTQRQGGGQAHFDYADVVEDFDAPYGEHERPHCQTVVTERDGQQTRHLFNRQGNLLMLEEIGRVDGLPVRLITHYRYNRDGNLVGVLSPLGSLTQALWGRDAHERRFSVPEDLRPEQDPDLTPHARLAFGNLLTVVKRGSHPGVGQLSAKAGLWSEQAFPDILGTADEDAIQKFTYEPDSGQLLTSSDPQVTRSADPDAAEDAEYQRRLTRYGYASGPIPGRLSAIDLPTPTLPDGRPGEPVRTLFPAYDDHGRVLESVAPGGLRTVNEYAPDTAGVRAGFLVGRTIDPGGFDLHQDIGTDDLGRTVSVGRPSARDAADGRFVSTVAYDELSRIVETVSTPPQAIRAGYSYDRAGHLIDSEVELADADGVRTGVLVTANDYDDEAQVVRQRIGDPAEAMKARRIRYDSAARPALVLSPAGRIQKLRYDERSLVAVLIDDLAGIRAVTRRTYDADGRLARVIDPRGATTRYAYDALGHNTEVEDALGNRLVRHVDKLGNPLAECFFERRRDDVFVLVHRREFGYDELGRLVVVGTNRFPAQTPISAAQVPTAFRDAGPGRPLRLLLFRDSVGNVINEVDQDGRSFPVRFDILGRVVSRSDPLGNEVHLRYDKEGNIIRVDRREVTVDPVSGALLDERWFAESFEFDELNRMTAHRTATGTSLFGHNSRGLPTSLTDRTGNRTEHDYDVFGRRVETLHLLQVSDTPPSFLPIRTTYSYNRDDQLTDQIDPLGRMTSFEYDTAGRLRRTVLADLTGDAYGYDRAGNVTSYRDRNGIRRDLTWDLLGHTTDVLVEAPPGASVHGAVRTQFEYDALGRITVAANDFATDRFDYDSLAALRETVSFTAAGDPAARAFVLVRETSDTGAVTALTYPSGRRLNFDRDALDRVVRVAQSDRGLDYPGDSGTPDAVTLATVEYQGLRPRRLTRDNGVVTTYGYDFSGRAVDVQHGDGTALVLRQQVLYDAEGRVRQRSEDNQGQPIDQQFDYDSLARLVAVRDGAASALLDLSSLAAPATPVPDPVPDRQPEVDALLASAGTASGDYAYDAAGNRLTARTSSGPHIYQPNVVDQYDAVDGHPLTHDPNGNRTEDDGFAYRYDFRDQLVELLDKTAGGRTRFLRDAFGRICAEEADAGTHVVLYDGRQVVEDYAATGLRRSVVSADHGDQYLLASSGGAEGFLLHDLTRSVRVVHDRSAVRSAYRYDEFGRLLTPVPPGDDNLFFFAGMRRAGASGAYHGEYRTYDPDEGRYLQRDPGGFVDGANLYTYTRNDPLSLSDPLGTESRQEHPQVAAKLGAELAYRHPEGFTLALPDVDRQTIRAYRQRINDPLDRGVGIRSRPPGMKTATTDIRRANRPVRDAFEASLRGGRRPTGTAVDHTVELQHIIRGRPGQFAPGADRVRPQDHRVQDSSLNSSQGSRAQKVKARQVSNGAPLDTSAGGVARERDINKLWNRQGYRTAMRSFGYYNLVGGTFSSLTSVGDALREGDFAGAAIGTSAYLGGAFEIGAIAAESSTLLSAGRWLGAPGAVVASGVIGVRIGTNLYENYVDKEMCLDAGSWVEELTGSRILGATAAAATAVREAVIHAPEAAYDYVTDNVTLDPDEIDWDRTLKPWKWF